MHKATLLTMLFSVAALGTPQEASAQTTAAAAAPPAAPAAQARSPQTDPLAADPLLQTLVANGTIKRDQAMNILNAGNSVQRTNALAKVLLGQNVITQEQYARIVGTPGAMPQNATPNTAAQSPATALGNTNATPGYQPPFNQALEPRAVDNVVPAVPPLRVLTSEVIKKGSILPEIKLPGGLNLQLNGYIKAGPVFDSSNVAGSDFPTPLLSADTGPTDASQFRIKARSIRFTATLEGLDPSPKDTIIGKVEFDFEGLFGTGGNGIRNEAPRLRLGYGRYQHEFEPGGFFALLVGQAYVPFGSSTLPNTIETTSFMQGFGDPYDREPQVRLTYKKMLSQKAKTSLEGDFAFTNPKYGIGQSSSGTAAGLNAQLGSAEQEGVDSGRPEYQGRVVYGFQLDHAPSVPAAEILVSGMQGRRQAMVTAANVPTAFKTAFTSGALASSSRWGYTIEATLPSRIVTASIKYYDGNSLGSFNGAGQGFIFYNKVAGLTSTATAVGTDGVSNVVFGFNAAGVATVAPQLPVRGTGGFIELGLPISRYFGANASSRKGGVDMNLHYGLDEAKARDVRQLGTTAAPVSGVNARDRSDGAFANIRFRYNRFLTYQFEQGYYSTRTLYGNGNANFALNPLLEGKPTHSGHNNRSEAQIQFVF